MYYLEIIDIHELIKILYKLSFFLNQVCYLQVFKLLKPITHYQVSVN